MDSADQLIDAMVELLVRLHLAGVFWGDCSLSNTLFRLDAGAMSAYLVDAETAERHAVLTPGQRAYDVQIATERVGAELLDLEAGGLLPAAIDPVRISAELPGRYGALWDEVTREEVFRLDEQRFRVAERLQRLNDLGFAVGEVELVTEGDGARLRVRTQVAEPGQHRRELFRLTGLEVQENQARRLLNDFRSFRAHLEQKQGAPVPETSPGTGGSPRSTSRSWTPSPPTCGAGSRLPRSSTRCSSTGGSCPSGPVGTSAPGRRRGPTSRPCCPGRRAR